MENTNFNFSSTPPVLGVLDLCTRKRPHSPDRDTRERPHSPDRDTRERPHFPDRDTRERPHSPHRDTRKRPHSPCRDTRELPHSPDRDTPSRPPIDNSPSWQYSPRSSDSSEGCEISNASDPKMINLKSKTCRPFKAYIKDPLTLVQGLGSNDVLLQKDSGTAFLQFREKVLSQVQTPNNGTNKNMRRTSNYEQNKNNDPTYWEKRKKNNEAAKKSRDARRHKEDELAIRCVFLERENVQMKFVIDTLKQELEQLRQLLYIRGPPKF